MNIQHTKERTPDVLKKVTDRSKNTFVLHLEWQSKNDKDMVYRMAEYAVMLYRKYRLPVEQHVIYVGKGVANMSQTIEHKNFKFTYNIITLKKIDYKIFLSAKDPAIKVLAILCSFEEEGEERALENILRELKANTTGSLKGNMHFNQLCILVKLRSKNINLKFKKMISVSSFYKEEEDVRYILGEESAQKKVAIRMKNLGYDVKSIATALNISMRKVKEFQKKVKNEKSSV
jgi:predicted transposase YdaD